MPASKEYAKDSEINLPHGGRKERHPVYTVKEKADKFAKKRCDSASDGYFFMSSAALYHTTTTTYDTRAEDNHVQHHLDKDNKNRSLKRFILSTTSARMPKTNARTGWMNSPTTTTARYPHINPKRNARRKYSYQVRRSMVRTKLKI